MIVLMLMMSGCSVVQETGTGIVELPEIEESVPSPSESGQQLSLTLYYLNIDRTRFQTETRNIQTADGENLAKRAVEELILGTKEYGLRNVAPQGVTVTDVLVGDEIASVYLAVSEMPDQKSRYFFEYALTNTLSDLLSIKYVNVYWNGAVQEMFGLPYGLKTKFSGNIAQNYSEELQKAQTEANGDSVVEVKVALYFPNSENTMVLPEVRNVVVKEGNYIEAVVEEIKKGPRDRTQRNDLLTADHQLNSYTIGQIDGILQLDFDKIPSYLEYQDYDAAKMFFAGITNTFIALIPAISGVSVTAGGTRITGIPDTMSFEPMMTNRMFYDFNGSSIDIYLQAADSELLTSVSRTVAASRRWDLKTHIQEMMKGPNAKESETVWPIFPAGVEESDLLDIYRSGETICVDFSNHFYEVLTTLSESNERLLIYGIVNTVLKNGGNRVRFLQNGQAITQSQGSIDLKASLWQNPGLIKEG